MLHKELSIDQPWTIQELAEYLRLHPNTVRDMAAGGKIPIDAIVKPPGTRKYLFDPRRIIEWAKRKSM